MVVLSTLKEGKLYGKWHYPGDIVAAMDEIHDYVASQEFWWDHCKGNLNRKNYDFERLQTVMYAYEAMLHASLFQLESLGWHFEPDPAIVARQLEYL